MVTVQETQGTLKDLIDDVADMLESLDAWSDADVNVDTSMGSTDPMDNGRVFANSVSGTFVYIYAHNGDVRSARGNTVSGLRIVHSTDWDALNARPAGYTNVLREDSFTQETVLNRYRSFNRSLNGHARRRSNDADRLSEGDERSAMALNTLSSTRSDRNDIMNEPVTYLASADDNRLQMAAWNHTNSSDGLASFFSWEYVGEKFVEDGVTPTVMVARDTERDSSTETNVQTEYGFNIYGADHNSKKGTVGAHRGCIQQGEWGTLNPDADDDTFFYRRCAIYSRGTYDGHDRSNSYILPWAHGPVAFMNQALPNSPSHGAAHGDTIAAGGNDYVSVVQSGAGRSNPLGVALRYE